MDAQKAAEERLKELTDAIGVFPSIGEVRNKHGNDVAELYKIGIELGVQVATQAFAVGAMLAQLSMQKGSNIACRAVEQGASGKLTEETSFAPVDPERELTDED